MRMDADELVRSNHFIKKSIDTLRLSYFFLHKVVPSAESAVTMSAAKNR